MRLFGLIDKLVDFAVDLFRVISVGKMGGILYKRKIQAYDACDFAFSQICDTVSCEIYNSFILWH